MADILIIDDDHLICDMMSHVVKGMGHDVDYALLLQEGLRKANSGSFDVVFLDVSLPDGNGIDALPEIRQAPSAPEAIIITGMGDPDGAELAIKNGAWDYVQKPFSPKEIILQLSRALQYREEKETSRPPVALKRESIIGQDPRMEACFDLLAQAAGSEANVVITGETGTGKELFARAIHDNSRRAGKKFLVVDCAAMPETLVESMLLGHEKGAFTGADKDKDGLIKQAHQGTLFLDEVGELPLALQKAFLRVLQERRFRPVGGKQEVESDFRLVAATNRNLDSMMQSGLFRKDLLFRLRSIVIKLPPLREHPEDIKDLVMYYMARFCEGYGIGMKGFSPEFLEVLDAYDWPGNVRELINTLERVLISARDDPTLFPKHLPTEIRIRVARASIDRKGPLKPDMQEQAAVGKKLPTLRRFRRQAIDDIEREYLKDLLSLTGGDIEEACRISGLSRSRLYGLLKTHELPSRG